jgi:hypothetical protein
MKILLTILCLVLMSQLTYSADSLTVDFQGSFNADSVTLLVNGELVYQGILTTDIVAGIAGRVAVSKSKAKYYDIVIRTKDCVSKFRFKTKWRHLGITFLRANCSFDYKLSKKEFIYL